MDEVPHPPGSDRPARHPDVPDTPPPPPPPPPPAWPSGPPPVPQQPSAGFPWKVLGIIAAIGLVAVVVVGVLAANFITEGRLTAHVDRANAYLDALRSDRPAAEAMLCPGARDPNARALARATGQYLAEFDVAGDRGEVTGSVGFTDGTSRAVTVLTSGPAFPGGEDPAAQVCIEGTSLP